jgi:HPt (histidine-containing phosphotransfer) domain-containing protein
MLDKWVHASPFPEKGGAEANEREAHMTEIHPVLDQGVIASLRELGGEDDPGLFIELVNLFLSDTPERLHALGEAMDRRDPSALERAAHALKSSSANLGATELSALFRDIESGRTREGSLARRAAGRAHLARVRARRGRAALRDRLGVPMQYESFEELKHSGKLPTPSGVGMRILVLTRSRTARWTRSRARCRPTRPSPGASSSSPTRP